MDRTLRVLGLQAAVTRLLPYLPPVSCVMVMRAAVLVIFGPPGKPGGDYRLDLCYIGR